MVTIVNILSNSNHDPSNVSQRGVEIAYMYCGVYDYLGKRYNTPGLRSVKEGNMMERPRRS